jgi:hypothetical protein
LGFDNLFSLFDTSFLIAFSSPQRLDDEAETPEVGFYSDFKADRSRKLQKREFVSVDLRLEGTIVKAFENGLSGAFQASRGKVPMGKKSLPVNSNLSSRLSVAFV